MNVTHFFSGPRWPEENSKVNGGESGVDHDDGAGGGENGGEGGAKPKTAEQAASEALAQELSRATSGIICDVETALVSLLHKERRAKKPFPWKVMLEIGPDVRVNVVGYIKVKIGRSLA